MWEVEELGAVDWAGRGFEFMVANKWTFIPSSWAIDVEKISDIQNAKRAAIESRPSP